MVMLRTAAGVRGCCGADVAGKAEKEIPKSKKTKARLRMFLMPKAPPNRIDG
jgi:hypothetical protein